MTETKRDASAQSTLDGPRLAPQLISGVTQPLLRALFLSLARYSVKIEGEFPKDPSLLLAYPHNEHINSILFPPNTVAIVAARDYWYDNAVLRFLVAGVADTLPLTRHGTGHKTLRQEISWQKDVMEQRNRHIVVYPQGSRSGASVSPGALTAQLQSGVPYMARKLDVPVYPVGFAYPDHNQPKKGGASAWTRFLAALRQGKLPEPTTVVLRVGEPLDVPLSRDGDHAFLTLLAQQLWHLAHTKRDLQR